jgi:hypothetical protein
VIDDIHIEERPEPEAVSREEANGMWTQLDAARIALQSAANDITDIKTKLSALASSITSDLRWGRALLFLLLLERVGAHILASAPAQAVVASVWP